jgi:hypothetical protein
MTYRASAGLGAAVPQLTSDQIASLFKAFNAQGGCTGAFGQSLSAMSCIPAQLVQWFGSCFTGITPPGMSDMEYYAACMGLAKCGAFDKLGCPADGAALLASMPLPDCMTDAMYGEVGPFIDYCKANPTFQGPNKPMNTACWSASRYPDIYKRILNTPRCAIAAPLPPAPPAAPPVYTAPSAPAYTAPPPNTSAPVTYDTSATTTSAPDSTPTTLPTAPSDVTLPTTSGGSQHAGMGTGTMAMIGIGGALALGLGYMLLKKK